jgi:hypothetical protein
MAPERLLVILKIEASSFSRHPSANAHFRAESIEDLKAHKLCLSRNIISISLKEYSPPPNRLLEEFEKYLSKGLEHIKSTGLKYKRVDPDKNFPRGGAANFIISRIVKCFNRQAVDLAQDFYLTDLLRHHLE